MDNKVFEECLKLWEESNGNSSTEFWPKLAKKYKTTVDALRSSFKRERKVRGIVKVNNKVEKHEPTLPKVGILDVETLPMMGYMWSLWDVNFSLDQILKDSCMLSWAGKYLYSDNVYSDVLTPKEAKERKSERITDSLFNFMKECDIIIGHNFRNFDAKVINTEFLLHGFRPLRYRIIDTLEVLKNNFRFPSNKMAYINKRLGIREKVSNQGFILWSKCSDGDPEALKEMLEYNIGDSFANEETFWKVQPYISNLPNFSLYDNLDTVMCSCGSEDISKDGYYFLNSGKYDRYICNECGAMLRGKKNLLSKEKRSNILVRL